VHLHVHSGYSLLDGAIKIPDLVDTALEMGMPAVALTDHGQMFGVLNFYWAAKEKGLKPIIGVEAYVSPDRFSRDKYDPRYHLVLLAQNMEGYRNLTKLVTLANTEGFYYKPRMDYELLKKHNGGLIALTACLQGELARKLLSREGGDSFKESLERYLDFFPDRLYLEIQENQIPDQSVVNRRLIEISQETGVPLVATNDCHYLKETDYAAHDVLLCVQTNSKVDDFKRMRMPFNTYHFRSPAEMRRLFAYCPEACDNTLKIADRCELELPKRVYRFPAIKIENGLTPEESLRELALKGLEEYFAKREEKGKPLSPEETEAYRSRLEEELEIIISVGFAGYFLIVADFIRWARSRSIPVGPGRGSAAGSLVAFSLKITRVDPLRFDLLFERFLNPQRVSMPDIDVDFCAEGRQDVLDYVVEAYGGPDHVAQILTLGQLKARAVIRDVGRALDVPLHEVDLLAKLVPADPKITLAGALKSEPRLKELYKKDKTVKKLIDLAGTLEGLPRHASIHASGVVIADKPLTEYLPLFTGGRKQEKGESKGLSVTQFEGGGVEKLGLIKFDFLGLKTLTLIKHCLRLLSERGIEIDIEEIDQEDPETFEFFRKGNLNGVFQMEQEGIRQYLRMIRPDKLSDIISLLALYRPGPLKSGQADQFVAVRRGTARPSYVHDSLKPILEETVGVILYQEQVLRIAQVLAGFSLGDADLLRRAMGKKKKEEMDKIKPEFILRCEQKGLVDSAAALAIFEQLEKFAEYGFNKSHSAAYALVSYQTAWLKCRYPVEFMAALMTSEMADKEKIASLIHECREEGIKVLPPDVNSSGYQFTVKGKTILFGLGAIRGAGQGAVEQIIEARKKKPFTSFFDFCDRAADGKVNKKVAEALILSGALDASGGASREVMLASLDAALTGRRNAPRLQGAKRKSLFEVSEADPSELNWSEASPFSEAERLASEKEFLGFYVTGHPLARYASVFRAMGLDSVAGVLKMKSSAQVRLAGTFYGMKFRTDKKGSQYAFLTMEDMSGKAEVILWSDALTRFRDLIDPDRVLVCEGSSDPPKADSPYGAKIIIDELWDLEEELEERVKSVTFTLPVTKLQSFADFLEELEPAENDQGPVFHLRIKNGAGYGLYRLDPPPKLTLELCDRAEKVLGEKGAVSCSLSRPAFEKFMN
jgi:DNA polymerase-3 subunit alpha